MDENSAKSPKAAQESAAKDEVLDDNTDVELENLDANTALEDFTNKVNVTSKTLTKMPETSIALSRPKRACAKTSRGSQKLIPEILDKNKNEA